MRLMEIRGKKANEIRWNALKLLDWEKDHDVIGSIMSITNPRFFSSRTPEECINQIRKDIEFRKFLEARDGN